MVLQILAPAVQQRDLTELAVAEGFVPNRHGLQTIIVGVDARWDSILSLIHLISRLFPAGSIWFTQAQFAFRAGHAQAGENPELRAIFYKLAHLLQIPITPLFVFNGAQRLSMKRGVRVVKKPNWLTKPMQELISAFGFEYYTVCILWSRLVFVVLVNISCRLLQKLKPNWLVWMKHILLTQYWLMTVTRYCLEGLILFGSRYH